MNAQPIQIDFKSGKISGANLVERTGLELMRASAYALASRQFLGFSWVAKVIRTLLPSQRDVRVIFADDRCFDYPYGDGYWGVLLYNKKLYSQHVELILMRFSDTDYAFVDCGSNFGYMSVQVSGRDFGGKPCMAIEADLDNYSRTVHNAQINGNRYQHRHNAVFSTSGNKVNLFGSKHEAYSIKGESGQESNGVVETLALDDLLDWLDDQGEDVPVVLKLDVEGVEIDALKGAEKLMLRPSLIIYEEHGNDPTHEISHFIRDELSMRLFMGTRDGKFVTEITDWAQLDNLKQNPREGYDILASNSGFWLEKLEHMRPGHNGVH